VSFKPYKFAKALWYALLLWLIGFVWGTIVFVVPTLKNVSSVQYISKYPVISLPLMMLYAVLLFFLSGKYLRTAGEKFIEGLKFGITLFLVSFFLDVLVYFFLFKGKDYFAFLSIWLSYAMFIAIPCFRGQWLQKKKAPI